MANHLFLWLKIDGSEAPVQPDSGDFLYEIEGQIVYTENIDDGELIGRFRVFYVDADAALNAKCSYFDVLDERAETAIYYDHLFGSDESTVSPALEKLLGEEPVNQNALILDRLEILPQYRGKRYGLVILRRLIERFGTGAGIVAMKPFPLQFEGGQHPSEWRAQQRLDDFPKDQRKATARLQRYYGALGFKRLPGTDFMFLLTAYALPTVQSLLVKPKV